MSLPIKPQLLETRKNVEDALRGREGAIEPKLDGWRMVAHIDGGVRLYARSGADLTSTLPEVCEALAELPDGTILDGEAVSLRDEWGTVQSVLSSGAPDARARAQIQYAVFDVMAFGGEPSRQLPYRDRRPFLESVMDLLDSDRVRLVPSFPAEQATYDAMIETGFEGGVVKLADSRYNAGKRGAGWFRLKPTPTLDVVAIGFTGGEGERGLARGLGAIEFGQFKDGKLVSRGACGTGFDDDTALNIWRNREQYLGQVFEVTYFGCTGNPAEACPRTPSFNRWRIGEKDAEACVWEVLHR